MATKALDVGSINEEVYRNLNGVLKRLNKRLYFKFYSIIIDNQSKCKAIKRVKSTLSSTKGSRTEINQEPLKDLQSILDELDIKNANVANGDFSLLAQYLLEKPQNASINTLNTKVNSTQDGIDSSIGTIEMVKSRLLYTNSLLFSTPKTEVAYIIEIRNIDVDTYEMFYDYPQLSFLRMVLDVFFADYFENDGNYTAEINKSKNRTKYNEDSTQFTRRITRLYLGKIQSILQEEKNLSDSITVDNATFNRYYVNNLLEKIDDMSTRTYEGSNPFGCMLLLNQHVLQSDSQLLKYTIKFQQQDRVSLDDSKRIRKLLELTNNEIDLFLISDHEFIYGLGEINWSELGKELLFKVQFKGLSKYSLYVVATNAFEGINGRIVIENEMKVFKTEKNMEILYKPLVNISFKNPELGEEGYTPEGFKRIIKSQFFEHDGEKYETEINELEKIVRKAREQKHGTMVVITDDQTAIVELKTLKKQSTLIEPTFVTPDYIKHLTAIDGAIYFDTSGKCHAIGVILDGVARENVGDSSRGARFNSAHRYLAKLKDLKKKCVIAIISEDRMVNIIPEMEDEENIFTLFQQIIDLINEENEEKHEELSGFESQVLELKDIDSHLFFKVADTYFNKGNFERCMTFLNKGIESSRNGYVISKYYRQLAQSYLQLGYKSAEKSVEYISKVVTICDQYIVQEREEELIGNDYNIRALALRSLGVNATGETQSNYNNKALADYSKALHLAPKSAVIHSNRSYLRVDMGYREGAIDDLITAELVASNEDYVNRLMKIIDKDSALFEYALVTYIEKKSGSKDSPELTKVFEEYRVKLEEENPEVAATLEKYSLI